MRQGCLPWLPSGHANWARQVSLRTLSSSPRDLTVADDPSTPGDEAHGFMPHYDQHFWLFRENPMGEPMPFNPNVTCKYAGN
jgi:hypothetical protein